MKRMLPGSAVVASLLLTLGLSGPGRAVVFDHLYSGRIVQGQINDDPSAAGLAYFMLEVETDASVSYVDFMTAMGQYGVIPADPHTTSAEIDTYHWVDGDVHIWEYWGYFANPDTLRNYYGDGSYIIVLHYTNGSQEPTTVWYAIPGTDQALPAPTQIPRLQWPPSNGSVASPVSFEWEPVIDPNVGDVYLSVLDENDEYIITEVYGINATQTSPFGLREGLYDIELAFESFYSITNPDGIPFDVSKNVTLLQSFEVLASSVYRFYSPVTGRHFYTIKEGEKNKLIANYSGVWTFEGPVFYAWSTPYDPDLVPVYRFWSSVSSSHFYTIKEGEKNKLITQFPHIWTYEGVAFYAYAPDSPPADASPVYRFWKGSDNTHFYTIDPAERDKLLNQYSHIYTFEGVAFYAWE